MKTVLLLILCLLLCGCTPKPVEVSEETPTFTTAAAVSETEPVSLYQPGHPLEEANRGALRVNPLITRKTQGMLAMGDDLILLSGYGSTTLTRLTGRDLTVAAEVTLDFELDPRDPSLRCDKESLCYYDPTTREIVIRNRELMVQNRYPITETTLGSPILSSDRNTVYYCTRNAIRAWDQNTGIHRTLKELSYNDQQLSGLLLNDTVLQCRIQDGTVVRSLFLSAENGQLLGQQDGDVSLQTQGTHYYACLPASDLDLLIFGTADSVPQVLYPRETAAKSFFLKSKQACLTAVQNQDGTLLSYYSLDKGALRAELLLPPLQMPKAVCTVPRGGVYILTYDPNQDCDTVYCWDVPAGNGDPRRYTDEFSSEGSLSRSQTLAAQLEAKYGIGIRIGEDALTVQPWDYHFEAETLDRVLLAELEALDIRLSQYPTEILGQTSAHFSSLTVSLVRSIHGTPASGSLDAATGIQFLDGTDAYVVITVGKYAEQALYHELFHVMETHILAESTAFDQWEEFNPHGFQYHYGTGLTTEQEAFLSDENRAFIDAYSMSFPKEDRARILENAILPGNVQLFRSSALQAKLTKLCQGIRQAYGLQKSAETFIWEQYLNFPLAYME